MDFSEATNFTADLIGERVSQVWRGAGTAIFLELGSIEPARSGRGRGGSGCIGVEWSWRVERGASILGGSFSEDQDISSMVESLQGLTVQSIAFFGRIPEIEVGFASGDRLLSFSTVEGDPEWSIRVADRYLSVVSGLFVYESAA